ncbi:hypothetical protein Tco_0368077 [Tanacetum coccineum]
MAISRIESHRALCLVAIEHLTHTRSGMTLKAIEETRLTEGLEEALAAHVATVQATIVSRDVNQSKNGEVMMAVMEM